MYDVVALGELLIDFTDCGKSNAGLRLFEQNPGGAPANVLCALSNLGIKTAFIGKVGKDMHGDFLTGVLNDKMVCTKGLIADPAVFTTLAFVALSLEGERSFSFARKPGADTCLRPDELNMQILQNTNVFHFGSLTLTDEPARSATYKAIEVAKQAGAIISYDPNYRAPLWESSQAATEQMRGVLKYVDIIKISDEETTLLTGKEAPEEASEALIALGISCTVVTLGKDGALVRTREGAATVKAPECNVVDTTGAGDAFWGGFLYKLLKDGVAPACLSLEKAKEYARFANMVAGLCVQRRGAIPAMPTEGEVLAEWGVV